MSFLLLLAGCSSAAATKSETVAKSETVTKSEERQTFAQAHDVFKTNLVKHDSDENPIPDLPAGVFEL